MGIGRTDLGSVYFIGNDDESDQPRPPVKTVDKTTTRTVKRNADGEAPATKAPAGQGRRGGFGGNEAGMLLLVPGLCL